MQGRTDSAPSKVAMGLTVGITALVAVGLYVTKFMDTAYRRRSVAEELQTAKTNILQGKNVDFAERRIRQGARSSYSFERTYALTVIGELGGKAAWALPELLEALKSDDPFVLREAARAVGSLGPLAAPAVPTLIQLLRKEGTDASWFSADSLGNMGSAAVEAIPQLKIASQSSDSNLRDSASASLAKLMGKSSPK